jgi:hypothetical protein
VLPRQPPSGLHENSTPIDANDGTSRADNPREVPANHACAAAHLEHPPAAPDPGKFQEAKAESGLTLRLPPRLEARDELMRVWLAIDITPGINMTWH